MSESFMIQVNGETRETPSGTTITALLHQLGLNQGRVAIEYNLHILPKAKWSDTQLAHGDRLEIVQFVGGG
jgi:thiamine biosynthesis protein ThiS